MIQQQPLRGLRKGIGLIMVGVIGIVLLGTVCRFGGGSRSSSPSRSASPTAEIASINARDETGELLPGGLVNIWDDYQSRGRVVARCKDGERVTVLRRSGNGVQIKTSDGVTGWVSDWFLK